LPIFPYDGELDQRPGEENNGQIVESTPSKPRRYYLARIADVGSVPVSTTIDKGSDDLLALFFACDPCATRGSGPPCWGCRLARTLDIGHF
jgi:hypothetical protein